MKKNHKLICLAALLGLLALTAQVALAQDSLSSMQREGAKKCASYMSILQQTVKDLNGVGDIPTKYPSLNVTTTISISISSTTPGASSTPYGCALSPIKNTILAKVLLASTTIDGFCSNLASSTSVSVASSYMAKINDFQKNYMAMVMTISKVDNYYSSYRKLFDTVALIYSFRNIKDKGATTKPFSYTLTKKGSTTNDLLYKERVYIYGTDYGNNDSFLGKIAKNMLGTNKAYICMLNPAFTGTFGSPTTFSSFSGILNTKKSTVDGLNGTDLSTLLKYMNTVMVETAKDGWILADTDSSYQYTKDYPIIWKKYEDMRLKLIEAFNKKVESEVTLLNSYTSKLANASLLANMSSSNPNIAESLKNSIAANMAELNRARETSNYPVNTYNNVASSTQRIERLNNKGVVIKNIDLTIKFNKDYGKALELKAVCDRFLNTNSKNLLRGGLSKASDQAVFDSLVASFNGICSPDVAKLMTDKPAIESAIVANTVAGASTTTIKALTNLLSVYSKNLSNSSQKVSKYRSDWWKLIEIATIEGNPAFTAGFAKSTMAAETKAKKIYEDFEKKRGSYMEKAQKIIDSRKLTLRSNQALMDSATDIVNPIKAEFKLALDTLLADYQTTSSLDNYMNNSIRSENNYNDLVLAVNDIKTTFKLNEVVIPLQKNYLQLDSYYVKNALLYSVKENLRTRMISLGANTTTEMTTKLTAITNSLKALYTIDLNGPLGMNNSMVKALENLDESAVKAIAKQSTSIKTTINAIGSDEKKLLTLVANAEKEMAKAK